MKHVIYLFLIFIALAATAQENNIYQKPPQEILELVDVQRAPSVLMDDKNENMVLLYRNSYKTIQDLSQKELRLGGLRIDPQTNIGSRVTYYIDIKIKNLKNNKAKLVSVIGIPENPRFSNFSWSPDQKMIALTNTSDIGVELWILDISTASVYKLTDANVNANMGDVINWFEDSKSLLIKTIPDNRKSLIETENAIPTGPTISVNDGKKLKTEHIRICSKIKMMNTILNN